MAVLEHQRTVIVYSVCIVYSVRVLVYGTVGPQMRGNRTTDVWWGRTA